MNRENPTNFTPSLFDIHLGKFLVQRSGLKKEEAENFRQAIQQLSNAIFAGHSCLHTTIPEIKKLPPAICIDKKRFEKGEKSPLVYDNSRLYFYRYYNYEYRLAEQLHKLAKRKNDRIPPKETIEEILTPLFDGKGLQENEPDLQRKATETALQSPLTVISGGPGTGKTTTVVKILAALLTLAESIPEKKIPRTALCAPTGKAAMRLAESIKNALSGNAVAIGEGIRKDIPTQASTLHRLLGVRRDRPDFLHNQKNPLDFDIVVIDEASMVDLALMSKLVDSLKPQTRLILLGDKDQLASVESGAVLADIMEALPECGVQLKKSWRFEKNIAALASAINNGNWQQAEALFADKKRENLHRIAAKDKNREWLKSCAAYYHTFMDMVQNKTPYKGGLDDRRAAEIFTQFNSFRILCALRKGKYGMEQINSEITNLLAENYFCKREKGAGEKNRENWYPGRPIMITENDYTLELYNGDIGICLYGRDGEKNYVWFESHSENSVNKFRIISLNRLPQFETSFAMTIHKSQGSEFANVAVILPEKRREGKVRTLLSRELLYTAVTRAKEEVFLIADKEVMESTITARIERTGGLRERLTEGGAMAAPSIKKINK